MKSILFIIFLFSLSISSYCQTISYKDLLFIINNEETEKIDDFLSKKGFEIGEVSNSNDCGSFDWNYKNTERKLSNVQMIKKLCDEQNNKVVLYTSTNSTNYEIIRKDSEEYSNPYFISAFINKGLLKYVGRQFQLSKISKNYGTQTEEDIYYQKIKLLQKTFA